MPKVSGKIKLQFTASNEESMLAWGGILDFYVSHPGRELGRNVDCQPAYIRILQRLMNTNPKGAQYEVLEINQESLPPGNSLFWYRDEAVSPWAARDWYSVIKINFVAEIKQLPGDEGWFNQCAEDLAETIRLFVMHYFMALLFSGRDCSHVAVKATIEETEIDEDCEAINARFEPQPKVECMVASSDMADHITCETLKRKGWEEYQ